MSELVTWTPFHRDVFGLWNQLENEFFGRPRKVEKGADFVPALDLHEEEERFVLSFDIPGVDQKDITLEVQEGVLKVFGERKLERKEKGHWERLQGKFERRISLPENVDLEKIEAEHKNGVLTVTVPKRSAVKPRKIEIKA